MPIDPTPPLLWLPRPSPPPAQARARSDVSRATRAALRDRLTTAASAKSKSRLLPARRYAGARVGAMDMDRDTDDAPRRSLAHAKSKSHDGEVGVNVPRGLVVNVFRVFTDFQSVFAFSRDFKDFRRVFTELHGFSPSFRTFSQIFHLFLGVFTGFPRYFRDFPDFRRAFAHFPRFHGISARFCPFSRYLKDLRRVFAHFAPFRTFSCVFTEMRD